MKSAKRERNQPNVNEISRMRAKSAEQRAQVVFRANAEFGVDMRNMRFNGVFRDGKVDGNLLSGIVGQEHKQHLSFGIGQAIIGFERGQNALDLFAREGQAALVEILGDVDDFFDNDGIGLSDIFLVNVGDVSPIDGWWKPYSVLKGYQEVGKLAFEIIEGSLPAGLMLSIKNSTFADSTYIEGSPTEVTPAGSVTIKATETIGDKRSVTFKLKWNEIKPAHVWATEWTTNETHHWHECMAADCDVADNSQKDGYAAHVYKRTVATETYKATEATHTAKATYYYSCECGATGTNTFERGETIPHNYATEWSKNETHHWHECECGAKADNAAHVYGEWQTNDEKHWKECECGEKAEESAHTFGDWQTITAATESQTGLKKRVCSACAYEESQTIPVLGHEHAYAAEWSSNGEKHWKECECGEKAEESEHTFGEWQTVTAATESQTGIEKRVCSVCAYEESKTIPVLGHEHAFGEWKKDESKHWKECECGAKAEDGAHAYADDNDATCDVCGFERTLTPVDPTDPTDPTEPKPEQKSGLSGGAIAGITVGATVIVGVGGFAIFWFVIKKKTFADIIALIKK